MKKTNLALLSLILLTSASVCHAMETEKSSIAASKRSPKELEEQLYKMMETNKPKDTNVDPKTAFFEERDNEYEDQLIQQSISQLRNKVQEGDWTAFLERAVQLPLTVLSQINDKHDCLLQLIDKEFIQSAKKPVNAGPKSDKNDDAPEESLQKKPVNPTKDPYEALGFDKKQSAEIQKLEKELVDSKRPLDIFEAWLADKDLKPEQKINAITKTYAKVPLGSETVFANWLKGTKFGFLTKSEVLGNLPAQDLDKYLNAIEKAHQDNPTINDQAHRHIIKGLSQAFNTGKVDLTPEFCNKFTAAFMMAWNDTTNIADSFADEKIYLPLASNLLDSTKADPQGFWLNWVKKYHANGHTFKRATK